MPVAFFREGNVKTVSEREAGVHDVLSFVHTLYSFLCSRAEQLSYQAERGASIKNRSESTGTYRLSLASWRSRDIGNISWPWDL